VSAYRDDLEAARRRIDELEADIAERKVAAERLEASRAADAAELAFHRRKLAAPGRRLIMAGGAAVFACIVAYLEHIWRLDSEREVQNLRDEIARTDHYVEDSERLRGLLERHRELIQKAALFAKLQQATATTDEARMLKSICMSDGDRECRNAAVAYLNRMVSSGSL
jgi:hypothetical protein